MSLTENEKALAVMDDDGWGCAITSTPELPACVTISWSETRSYSATVRLTELADAVRAPGPVTDGHELPADLSELDGDPLDHGDLDGLLGELKTLPDFSEVAIEFITKEGA